MESRRPMDTATESLQDLLFNLPAMKLWFKLGCPDSIPQDDSSESVALRGLCLMTGLGGCGVDASRARELLEKAATLKSLLALDALGSLAMSEDPFGEKTLALARQAAELGCPEKLILSFMATAMVTNDPKAVTQALEVAERYGSKDGHLFWSLYRAFQSLPSSRVWLEKALDRNSPEAHYDMAELLEAEGKSADAEALLRTGAEMGESHCAGKLLAGYLRQQPHPDTEAIIPRYAEIAASDANPYYTLHYAMTFVDGRGRPADPKAAIPPLALLCLTRTDMDRSFIELTFSLIDRYYCSPTAELRLPSRLLTDWLFPRLAAKFNKESYLSYMKFLRKFAFLPESDQPKNLIVPT